MINSTCERIAGTSVALSLALGGSVMASQDAEAATTTHLTAVTAANLMTETVPQTTTKATAADIKLLQADLNSDLAPKGLPLLTVDGALGPQSRRALCVERLLTGGLASKADPTKEEIRQLQAKDTLSYKASGFIVSLTCQTLAVNNNGITNVIPVSTGNTAAGFNTPIVNTSIAFARTGWHNSSLYPTESGNGNMYRPLYFKSGGGIAIHGSREMNSSVTTAESHGCVRTNVKGQDILWKIVKGPTTSVQDKVVSVTSMPIHVVR